MRFGQRTSLIFLTTCVRVLNLCWKGNVSSKQLSPGNQYRRYIEKQVPSCEQGVMWCFKAECTKREERVPVGDRKVERAGIIGGRKRETVGKSHSCAEDVYYFQVAAEAEHTLPCYRDWQLWYQWGNASTGTKRGLPARGCNRSSPFLVSDHQCAACLTGQRWPPNQWQDTEERKDVKTKKRVLSHAPSRTNLTLSR